MGPREALEQMTAMINEASASNDLAEVHLLLRQMQSIASKAIGTGTLRRAKLLRIAQAS